jgi:hypothetical protein
MDTRAIAIEYRQGEWEKRIQDRNASGLSIKEYCNATGLNESSYFYWQRKIRETACYELSIKQVEAKKMAVNFTEVQLPAHPIQLKDQPTTTHGKGQLRVEIAGYKITANTEYPVNKLTEILREVARL